METIKNILILSAAAGSGHVQAARAKKRELRRQYPLAKIFHRDVYVLALGRFGNYFNHRWDRTQTKGNVLCLRFYALLLIPGALFFWIPTFFSILFFLLNKKIDKVITTQTFGLAAILKAIRVVNHLEKKSMVLETVMTELPTETTVNFFSPIKRLSKADKRVFRLLTTYPLLEGKYEDEWDFWKKCTHLTPKEIQYSELPVRAAFLNEKLILPYDIAPEDKISLIMLGSNPNQEAILKYIQCFIEMHRGKKEHLFIFPSKNHEVIGLGQFAIPDTLNIVLLPYVDDKVVAPLFRRADLTITRSGGLTSMELLIACNGQILIHEEKHGMVPWEAGNAEYLRVKKGARIVTPESFWFENKSS